MNKSLLVLSLDFNENLGSEGVSALCGGLRTNSSLKKLSLRYCCIDKMGGSPISEMLCFKKLALTILDLKGNDLGGEGLHSICTGLSENTKLEELNLADNGISSSETDLSILEQFGTVLSSHTPLHSIDLNHNPIGTKGGMILLDSVGPKNKRIKKFKVDKSISSDVYNLLCRTQQKKKVGGKKKKKKGKKKKK